MTFRFSSRSSERNHSKITGPYKIEKPNNSTGKNKFHLKCDCITGSIVNGLREPILFIFALVKPPGDKLYKTPRMKLFLKKINTSVSSLITLFL